MSALGDLSEDQAKQRAKGFVGGMSSKQPLHDSRLDFNVSHLELLLDLAQEDDFCRRYCTLRFSWFHFALPCVQVLAYLSNLPPDAAAALLSKATSPAPPQNEDSEAHCRAAEQGRDN